MEVYFTQIVFNTIAYFLSTWKTCLTFLKIFVMLMEDIDINRRLLKAFFSLEHEFIILKIMRALLQTGYCDS